MGVLAATIRAKVPMGRDWMVMLRVTTGAAAGDEYISRAAMGLSKIHGAFGTAVGPTLECPTFVYNSRGTDITEGTNKGDLAIESTSSMSYEVWIIGRGQRGNP
jgi:hypothetical protein